MGVAVPHRRNQKVTNYSQGTTYRKGTAALNVGISMAMQGQGKGNHHMHRMWAHKAPWHNGDLCPVPAPPGDPNTQLGACCPQN